MSDDKRDAHASSPPSPRSGSLSPMNAPSMTPPRSRSPSLSALQPVLSSAQPLLQHEDLAPMQSPRSRSSSLSAMQPSTSGPHIGQMEPVSPVLSPVQQRVSLSSPLLSTQQGRAQALPDASQHLSPMSSSPPRSATAISINEHADERRALLQPTTEQSVSSWLPTRVNAATFVAQATDAVGAGLSLSTALAPQSATVRNLVSGSAWAISGAIGTATGRATQAAWATGAGALNTLAGLSSVASTGFGTVDSPSWQADQASPIASYASNAAWAGAGLATIGDGVSTMRNASNWSATFAGTAQIASGVANVTAGAAGALSTYWHGQNSLDPRAGVASVVSGAAWVAGSAFGALGAGLSWYSRRGSSTSASSGSDATDYRALNV